MRSMTQANLDDATAERLATAAREVQHNAWAPYSGFRVGAAVLAADGRIFTGCNVENASYGLGVCAERHAIAAATAAGTRDLVAVAVVSDTDPPVAPCGACRQVLAEVGDLEVIIVGPGGVDRRTSVRDLLPDAFGPADLSRSGG